MSSRLKARVKRLEQRLRKKNSRVPSRSDYDSAAFRQRTRRVYSARLKLYRMSGREDELWQKLSDHDRKILENDTPELRAKDEDVMRRSEGGHCPTAEETAGHAESCLQKLRSMERMTVAE